MGQQRQYLENGGFSSYLYTQRGDTFVASNGVEGKVVEKIDGTAFDGLPLYSNTSEVYLKRDAQGNIIQARIYKDRKPVCDFDWNHEHTNKKTGEVFPQGTVHVQEFKPKNGTYVRDSKNARYMSDAEISRYGELIQMVCPWARLRP